MLRYVVLCVLFTAVQSQNSSSPQVCTSMTATMTGGVCDKQTMSVKMCAPAGSPATTTMPGPTSEDCDKTSFGLACTTMATMCKTDSTCNTALSLTGLAVKANPAYCQPGGGYCPTFIATAKTMTGTCNTDADCKVTNTTTVTLAKKICCPDMKTILLTACTGFNKQALDVVFSVMEKGGAMTVNDAMCAFPPNCVSITSSAPAVRPSTLLAIVPLLFSFVFVKF